jgi:hypothetical protein
MRYIIIKIYFVHNNGTIREIAGLKQPMDMKGVETLLNNPLQVLENLFLQV